MREGGALAAANTAAGYSPALTRVPMGMDKKATKEAAPFQQGQFVPGNLAQAQNQMQMYGMQGMTPVMSDPRGPITDGRPSFGGRLPGLGGPADKVVAAPTMRDLSKMFDTSIIDPRTGYAQRLNPDGTIDEGHFGDYQFYADRAKKDYETKLAEFQRQQEALGQDFTYGQLQEFQRKEGIQNLKNKHQNVDTGFFDSPEFKNMRRGPGGQAFTYSPYFGMHGDTSIGTQDQAYEAYLRRTGQTNKLRGGSDFIQAPGQQPRLEKALNTTTEAPSPDGLNPTVSNYIPPRGSEGQPPAQQQATTPAAQTETPDNIGESTVQRMYQPGLPAGGVTQAALTPTEAGQYIDPQTGLVTGAVSVPTAMATTAQAAATQESAAAQMQAATASPAVTAAVQATQAAQGTVDPRAQVTAAQQTASSVGNLDAAQGNASLINSPVQREIQAGELISGAADAEKAAQFTEQIQAAEATPSTQATVQGQLAQLTANFDAANPPAWAAGAMRNATAQMAARGLGASSLAGQAIVQATLEAALPIAQADAATVAQFEAQNLSNRQQRAMLAAQQRATFMGMEFDQAFQARVQNAAKISDIANQNFTAEQQVQLENSRAVNTMNLNNLSNRQALVMSQAAALAQMDTQNLNNRQQAAVQNAQNFLQMDMTNLSNQQQTEMFKAQQRIQSLFTDQAAENAARQFNATSQNQVDQFFANLAQQTSQFNAAQVNAQAQFNAGQANTVERFNAELNNQRDTFNAQNQLAIAQANAVWRREIATADTAAINAANQINAAAVLGISETAYENLWQYYADTMEWAWETADNEADRQANLAIAQMQADNNLEVAKFKGDYESSQAVGGFVTDVLKIGLNTGFKFGF